MIPDYSFELFFREEARTAVAHMLALHASPDCRNALEHVITSGAGSADLTLVVKPGSDVALQRWDEHAHIEPPPRDDPSDDIWIGAIAVWVAIHECVPYDDQYQTRCLNLLLWPVSRLMQETFLNSPTLRGLLTAVLSCCNGLVGYIDRGDGSLAEFWPNNNAPAGYEYELVRHL
jgi:hypothetical protein